MPECRFTQNVEQWFDGQLADGAAVEAHIEACAACRSHLNRLRMTRAGFESARSAAGISDAQLPHFLDGIRAQSVNTGSRWRGVWAMASMAAAALIATISIISLWPGGPAPAAAETVVEEHFTELEGASTAPIYNDGHEVLGVWLNTPPLSEPEI